VQLCFCAKVRLRNAGFAPLHKVCVVIFNIFGLVFCVISPEFSFRFIIESSLAG
jgi:hypothetical protein